MQPILRRQSLISPGDNAAALLKAAEAARESRFPRAVVTNNAADAPAWQRRAIDVEPLRPFFTCALSGIGEVEILQHNLLH